MLVSFDIEFISRDQKLRRNGEACRAVVKNTISVSFDITFISRDQKQRRNGEACRAVVENTISVSFDITFISRDQTQSRNGEACRASPTCFWLSLINLISNDTYVGFYLSRIRIFQV